MRKYMTALLALSFGATGIAHAQCVTYSLGYAVYTSDTLDNIQPGQGAPVPGSGGVTISGNEQSTQICHRWLAGGDCQQYITVYDSGRVSITVDGYTVSTTYGDGSTSTTIATALAALLNVSGSPVTASATGSAVLLTANTSGAGTNYTLSATSSTSLPSDFGGPSFSGYPWASTLTGGVAAGTLGDLMASVLIDGSASMTLDQATCPYPEYENLLNELPNATHTPSTQVVVNGVGGGWTSGTPVCVTCYLSEQNDGTDPITLELPTSSSSSGEVDCSVGGIIFTVTLNDKFEFAFTWLSKRSVPLIEGQNYFYPVTQNCSNTTQPDWYPATVEDSSPEAPIDVYWLSGAFMVRTSPTAYWTSVLGFTIAGYPSAYPPEPCTCTGPQCFL